MELIIQCLLPFLLIFLLLILLTIFSRPLGELFRLWRYKPVPLFPGIVVEKKLLGISMVGSSHLPLATWVEAGQVLFTAKNVESRLISTSHWRIEIELEVHNGRGETLRLDDVTTKIYWDREDVVLYQDDLLFNQDEVYRVLPKHAVNLSIVFDLMADDSSDSTIYLLVMSIFGLFLHYYIEDNAQLPSKLTTPSDSIFIFQDMSGGNLVVCNRETLSDAFNRHKARPSYLRLFKDSQRLLEQHLASLNSAESTD